MTAEGQPREDPEDSDLLRLSVLEVIDRRDDVAGELDEPVGRQVGAAKVADEDRGPACRQPAQPWLHARGQLRFVPEIARQNDVPAVVGAGRVGLDDADRHVVGDRVEPARLDGERLDVDRGDFAGAGEGRGDGHDPAARPDVGHVRVADEGRMIEQESGQCQPASPRPRPVRRWDRRTGVCQSRLLPERHGEAARPELDLRDERRRHDRRVLRDEAAPVLRGHPQSLDRAGRRRPSPRAVGRTRAPRDPAPTTTRTSAAPANHEVTSCSLST